MSLSQCHVCQHITVEGCTLNPAYHEAYLILTEELATTTVVADLLQPCPSWDQAIEVNFRLSLKTWQCLTELTLPAAQAQLLEPLITLARTLVEAASPQANAPDGVTPLATAPDEAPLNAEDTPQPSSDLVLQLQQDILDECALLEPDLELETVPAIAEAVALTPIEPPLEEDLLALFDDCANAGDDSVELTETAIALPAAGETDDHTGDDHPTDDHPAEDDGSLAVLADEDPEPLPEAMPEPTASTATTPSPEPTVDEVDTAALRQYLSSEPLNRNHKRETPVLQAEALAHSPTPEDFWDLQAQGQQPDRHITQLTPADTTSTGAMADLGRGSGRTKTSGKDPGIFFTL